MPAEITRQILSKSGEKCIKY